MKFGKNLIRNQVPGWSSQYINYKQLKRLIKEVAKGREAGTRVTEDDLKTFFYSLDRNIETVDKFYNVKYAEYLRRLNNIQEKIPRNGNPLELDKEDLEDVIGVLLDIRGQLRNLQWYGDMNKRGFVKILKKFDKQMGTSTQSQYLASRVFVLPFANGSSLDDKLLQTNRYLSELSPLADDEAAAQKSGTEKMLGDLELKRIPSNTSSTSFNAAISPFTPEMRAAVADDNVEVFESQIESATQQSLLAYLSKAVTARAKQCIATIIKRLESLDDSLELNGRNVLHRLVVNQGRRLMEENGKPRQFINPAELPRQPANLHKGHGAESSEHQEDELELMIYILSLLNGQQRRALVGRDQHNRVPLHHAAYYGLPAMASEILKHMKEWDLLEEDNFEEDWWKDTEEDTPISIAVRNNHPTTLKAILEYQSEKLEPDSRLLADATQFGSVELVKVLLDAGLDIDAVVDNETALFLACKLDLRDAAAYLLQRGANPEIPEATYGWTPVFVAAVDGYKEIAQLLVDAGCNISRVDGSGWTAMEHACLRGYLDLAEMLRPAKREEFGLANIDNSTGTSGASSPGSVSVKTGKTINPREAAIGGGTPRPRTPSPDEAIKTFGHRYLVDQSMVLITLGSTDRREDPSILTLDRVPYSKAHSTQLDTALSLVISASECKDEPCVLDMPIPEDLPTEPISFYVPPNKLDNVKLYFDLVPTYSSKKKILGRGVALLNNIYTALGGQKKSLHQTITLPIVESDTLEVLGNIKFSFMVVTPFEHPKMGISKSATYWKQLITTRVIGHRGMGKNSVSKKSLQLGENTLESFIQAANLGASYVEFDVQLTKDLVPVLYHDFLVAETGIDIPMHALTLEQFINVSELSRKERPAGNGEARRSKVEFSSLEAQQEKKESKNIRPRSVSVYQIDDDDEYEEMQKRMKFTRDWKTKGFKGNSRGHHIQSPFTTLVDVFKSTPKQVGFNIECKYPMLDESEAEDMETLAIELNAWVDTVLKCVYDNADGRDIIFSSFHPDICLMLSLKQPQIPVLFLTEGGTAYMADVRASSLQEAIRFAKRWQLLGIVSAAKPLILCPRLVNVVKESGLVCVTYGTDNNEPENARLQMRSGVDAVIVDSVLAIRKELTSTTDLEAFANALPPTVTE